MNVQPLEDLFPPLKKEKLVDVFINRFEALILSGKLSIGQKLPSERDLAAKLGVSRPVVHEGLIDLAAKGLVTRSASGGAVVNDYRQDGSLSILNSLLNFHDGVLEPRLAESVSEMRFLIEVENARLAARNRSPEQLEALKEILVEESKIDIGAAGQVARLDFRFHHLIAMASNNIVYPLFVNSFKTLYITMATQFFSNPDFIPVVFQFHTDLVGAIANQDENGAADLMRRMLDHGMTHYLAMIHPDK